MTWIADSFAKINLGLHVLEKLPTGYHRIETGLCFINWNDRLEITPADSMTLDVSEDAIPDDNRNLVMKAISVLRKYVGLDNNYRIKLEKRIPAGSGLGGGSSNAAAALRMFNKIEGLGLTDDELIDLSRELGADVPFFIAGTPAIAKGIGHQLEPAELPPPYWIVTCFPEIESSTTEAYQHCVPNPEPDFSIGKTLKEVEPAEWRYMLVNDLEQTVFPRHHLVGNLKDQMYELGAVYASMSGSGSAVYGLFEQGFVATDAYRELQELEYPVNITEPGFEPDLGIYRKA